ncbi:unnamed protein product [Eruca vesicaria subsp. sativa]|uniref:LRAT domain-containing protein n=1 Tax=Eruca vesicaria subsp. sativa TaxID=29727 RepID=A0ABC8KSI8_ERUVS|nr:unnamed protein product [Eruca vesicaria subsp. sativa]
MGLSNKISRGEVKRGDHIYTWCKAYTYAHHGIYVGDGKVVHFTHGRGPKTGIYASSSPNYPLCLTCEEQSRFEGHKVITSCLDCFLAGGKLRLYRYKVSKSSLIANRGGTCTLAPSDPPEDVLFRANFHLKIDGCFGDYHLTGNNCEDFAIYCKTGILDCKKNSVGISGQVNAATAAMISLAINSVTGLGTVAFIVYWRNRVAHDVSRNANSIKFPAEKLDSILKSDCSSPKEAWLSIAGA